MNQDIRWMQRYNSYKRALLQLEEAIVLSNERNLSNLEKQGFIQAFEFTHELAWKTMKDFLEYRGNNEIYGSRDAARTAFSYGLVEDGGLWMEMINSRNMTSHVYDMKIADEIIAIIDQKYFDEMKKFEKTMQKILDGGK
jgi:nucleotidyltransferase substrate binding protein (TIGR01987 family)